MMNMMKIVIISRNTNRQEAGHRPGELVTTMTLMGLKHSNHGEDRLAQRIGSTHGENAEKVGGPHISENEFNDVGVLRAECDIVSVLMVDGMDLLIQVGCVEGPVEPVEHKILADHHSQYLQHMAQQAGMGVITMRGCVPNSV